MQSTLTGTVHGRMIELERDTSLPDGARVRISLEPVELSSPSGQAQAAILESAGAWSDADDSEFDRWLESTRQTRSLSHRDEFCVPSPLELFSPVRRSP